MLRVGSYMMGKRNALVLRKTAVDYLGTCTVICTDKTGTLTEGKMTAKTLVTITREGEQKAAPREYGFYPLKGFNPRGGGFAMADLEKEGAKQALDTVFDEQRSNFGSVLKDLG